LRIREVRRARGLTLKQVAAELDMSIAALQRYEVGTARVTVVLLLRLARYFQVPMADLVAEEAREEPPAEVVHG
jgi:transcriptional regulator with XRE-family HTH domain